MVTKTITYKKQGNGQDSWVIRYLDEKGNNVQCPEILYEYPSIDVPSWKLKSVLYQMGLFQSVETALDNLPEPNKSVALMAWNYSPTINSESSVTKFVQQALQLSKEEVDSIFFNAENLSLEVAQNRMAFRTTEQSEEVKEGVKTIYKTVVIRKKSWVERLFDWLKSLFRKK